MKVNRQNLLDILNEVIDHPNRLFVLPSHEQLAHDLIDAAATRNIVPYVLGQQISHETQQMEMAEIRNTVNRMREEVEGNLPPLRTTRHSVNFVIDPTAVTEGDIAAQSTLTTAVDIRNQDSENEVSVALLPMGDQTDRKEAEEDQESAVAELPASALQQSLESMGIRVFTDRNAFVEHLARM